MKGTPQKKSFGRRVLIFLVGIFAIIGLLSMILCAINPIISPKSFVFTSYFGVSFWFILFFNLLILIVLILLKAKKIILVPLFSLIIAVPGFLNSYSVKRQSLIDRGKARLQNFSWKKAAHQLSDVYRSII